MKIYCLYFAWLIACIGTLSSLFFSGVLHMEPCHLCWYQRICLFPLVIILGIATYKGFTGIATYTIPLVAIGLFFALYQIFLQETEWELIDMCGAGPSCAEKVDIGLGFISLPMLSALAFLVMLILLIIALPKSKES